MNKVVLVGNLTKDPEYRTIPSGVSVCNFTIAVQRRFANQAGVREADFISCVAWRQQADFVHRYFNKGKKIGVCGTLQTRTYEAQDGSKRYITEVVCEECEFVESKGASNAGGSNYNSAPPAQKSYEPANDFAGQGFTAVEDDDQLPF